MGYLHYGPEAANVLLTTNKAPEQWGEVLHDPDLGTAIVDRLLHRGEVLHLTGHSYRQHRPGLAPSGITSRDVKARR